MQFLTTEYVKQEAEKGTLEALKCSREHHYQGATADKMDLIVAIEAKQFDVQGGFCACCARFDPKGYIECKKNKCPLYEVDHSCSHSLWGKLSDAFRNFEADYSNANFTAFQEAEAELCKYIEGKIEVEEAKAKKDEVTYSIGDRFVLEAADSQYDGKKFILSSQGDMSVAITHLNSGMRRAQGVSVDDIHCIPETLFSRMYSVGKMVRYYDNRKKEYTDGRDDKKECKCKADLKALDKVELKEGDFGHWNDSNDGVVIVVNGSGGEKRWYSPDEGQLRKLTANSNSNFVKAGNLKEVFDDLAAIGEGLEEFEIECNDKCGGKIEFSDNGDGKFHIVMEQEGKRVYMSAVPQDFILNLRRMEATLKTK